MLLDQTFVVMTISVKELVNANSMRYIPLFTDIYRWPACYTLMPCTFKLHFVSGMNNPVSTMN